LPRFITSARAMGGDNRRIGDCDREGGQGQCPSVEGREESRSAQKKKKKKKKKRKLINNNGIIDKGKEMRKEALYLKEGKLVTREERGKRRPRG